MTDPADLVARLRESTGGPLAKEAADEIERLRTACMKQNDEVCQIAGKALGYPWFKDDPVNFPGATEESGVCVGEHVAESIVAELAESHQHQREALADAAQPEVSPHWVPRSWHDAMMRNEREWQAEVRRLLNEFRPVKDTEEWVAVRLGALNLVLERHQDDPT